MRRRRNIWDEMRRMQEEMDRLFSNMWGYDRPMLEGPEAGGAVQEKRYRQPLTDVWETENQVIATVELPGVNKEDININVDDDMLEIKVEKKHEEKKEKKGMYRLERSYSGFYRSFALPGHVDPDRTKATYKNGVLEIKIPKLEKEKDKSKKVKVE
ncbi:Hsp20 family protein [Candidatus Woesearchaeota archaeon]|nr:Hsp20 family protein [Candidatus Woesearchaeota archaeon]